MSSRIRRLIASVLLIAGVTGLASARTTDRWADWRPLRFEIVGSQAGLPHATTTAIVQDRDGLLWIGTRGGLVRYDGQRVQLFKQSSRDPGSLPDNYVRSLHALPDGGVLVGTNVGGLVRFDPRRNRFVRPAPPDRGRLGSRVFAITPSRDGGVWVGSDRGAQRVDAKLSVVEGITPSAPSADPVRRVYAVHEDPDGTLWFGSDQGLHVRRSGRRSVQRMRPSDGSHALDRDVWAITRDSRGRLWVGTGSDGVLVGDALGRLAQPSALAGTSPLVAHRTVRAFAETSDGRMWIATDGTGVLVHDPVSGQVQPLRNRSSDPSSLAGDTVRDLMVDRTGGVWAATELGASRVDGRMPIAFTINSSMPRDAQSLADSNVRGLLTDRQGRVWVGLSNGRIDVLDRALGRVRHLTLNGRHAGQDIKALVQAADGGILVGARGVVRIDPVTFAPQPLPLGDMDGRPVISLAEVGRHLLIGSYTGLHVWDRRTGRLAHHRHREGDGRSLANDEVINITVLPTGEIWLSTPGGISRFDMATGVFHTYRNDPRDPASLPQDYASSVLTLGGKLWVGTYSGVAEGSRRGGLMRFGAITDEQGLAGDNVAALLADSRRRIWVSTAAGLSIIDPATREARVMRTRDGLPSGAFNQRAAAVAGDDLLFGGTAGVTVISADQFAGGGGTHRSRLAPTVVEVDGRTLPFETITSALNVPADARSLRIGFALLDYAVPHEIRYSYRLDGFDRRWTEVPAGTPASAVYTNLAGGNYVLHLRAVMPGLNGSTVERRLHVHVGLAWYEGWPARIGMLIAAGLLIFGLVQWRTRLLRRRAQVLERLVGQRTRELKRTNEHLERLATTDPLTGLLNRRSFMDRLDAEVERAARHGHGFAVALLDLDHFKQVNDRFGHHAGDEVLTSVAALVVASLRPVVSVARYGGEEIAILMPGSDMDAAVGALERLRSQLAANVVEVDGHEIVVTVSVGVSEWSSGETAASLLRHADEGLYQAKGDGRNRVHVPGYASVRFHPAIG